MSIIGIQKEKDTGGNKWGKKWFYDIIGKKSS